MAICVAFVDDHPILLEELVSLYSLKKDLSIVAQGHNAVDAIKIAEQHSPDVIVLDLSMPGDSLAPSTSSSRLSRRRRLSFSRRRPA